MAVCRIGNDDVNVDVHLVQKIIQNVDIGPDEIKAFAEYASLHETRILELLTLLKPLACLYHSLTEFNVLFLDKSNMNRIATASLHTNGSMFTNSRWPPKSHIEKVMVVRRTEIVFSIKLTPTRSQDRGRKHISFKTRTQRLDIVFVKASLDIFDHETRLAYL
jgi:hypothetical protein